MAADYLGLPLLVQLMVQRVVMLGFLELVAAVELELKWLGRFATVKQLVQVS